MERRERSKNESDGGREREKVGHSKRANKGEKQYTVTKQECVQSVQSITCVSSPQRGYLPL